MADSTDPRKTAQAKPRTVNEPPSDARANEPAGAAVQEHAQAIMDEGTEKGYLGEQRHEPNEREAYTLEGGAPTAELVSPVPLRIEQQR